MPVVYDNVRIIRPHLKNEWSKEQLQEYVKCAKSVEYFALNYVKAIHPVKGVIPLEFRPYQMELLKLLRDNKKVIGLQPRQSGKCVFSDTIIKIKNKKTNEIQEVTIEKFMEMCQEKKQ